MPRDMQRRAEWRERTRDVQNVKARDYQRRRQAEDPEGCRKYRRSIQLRKKYGLSSSDYAEMFEKQNGLCASCRQPEYRKTTAGEVGVLAVDHNHSTDDVRGLLCAECNTALGLLHDDPLRIAALLAYLEKTNGRQ